MCYQNFILLLVGVSVAGEDLTLIHLDNLHEVAETPEQKYENYMDIYTNHGDFKKVVDTYYGVTRRPNHRRFERLPDILHDISVYKNFPQLEKISPLQLENSVHLDRIDFRYPDPDRSEELQSNFGSFVDEDSQNKDNYVFMQSQKITTASEEDKDDYNSYKRPVFKTKYNKINSYVQKIPRATTTTYNKYEEVNLNDKKNDTTTKNRINELLKRYLSKLYQKKYNTPLANTLPRHEQKTKFFDPNALQNLKNKTINKLNKLFSLFTIVQFNNTACSASNSAGNYQGVCYIASQCSTLGGTALGNCASGYGVCCVFIGTCGGSGNQNCTYFQSPNYPDYYPPDGGVVVPTTAPPTNPSPTPDPRLPWNFNRNNWGRQDDGVLSCGFNVNKLNDNVSKMRIDFEDLELTGPTNGTCMNERLIISGQNTNNQVPIICGYNTGQHVYVDVSSLSGPLQISVLSATGARKRFKIKICQFEDTCLEPAANCLQYYTGDAGVISSFNYEQASMLARSMPGYFNNLNYAICIRREEGYCSITYRNVVNGVEYPFQLRNVDDAGNIIIMPGQAGADIFNCPDDYIVIDGTRLCGDKFNDGSMNNDFTMNADVTDTNAGPIVIPVRTDSMITGQGFKLFYTQNRCSNF